MAKRRSNRGTDPIAQADSLLAAGKPRRAEVLCRRALRTLEKKAGPDHPDVARALLVLGSIQEVRCEFEEAEGLYQRALTIFQSARQNVGIESLLARCLGALANLYREQGEYSQAESLLLQALEISERAFGPSDLEVTGPLNNLAVVYKYTGRFAQAERLYRRALGIIEKAQGRRHPDVATLYHNLGGLEHARGRYARGEPFARKAVRIREHALGPNHPDVAADVAALAALLDAQGKYDQAEPLYRRALAVFRKAFGPNHYEIAVNLNNLAALYYAKGQYFQPERLYRQALRIKEKLLGSDHPDVAMTLNNLAVFYKARGEFEAAEPLYRRAITIFERALGPAHGKVAACLDNYAKCLRAAADATEARAQKIEKDLEETAREDAAPKIDPRFAWFPLSVRPSRISRWGVFADEPIPPRRKVIEYTGKRVSRVVAARGFSAERFYLFGIDKYWRIDGSIGGSGAEYINHSCDPNCYARVSQGRIFFLSRRAVQPGEELTIDYHISDTLSRLPCHCGSPKCRGIMNVRSDYQK